MIEIETVLFDWNNTVADDFFIWWDAIQETFRAFKQQPLTIREYFEGLTGDYLELYRQRGISASREELNSIYELSYECRINEITLFPGIKETLNFLNRRLIITGLITQQKYFLIFPILEKFGLDKAFSYCECHALSKTEAICRILHYEKIRPEQCCFVGDAPSDINHGKKAGVRTAAFLNLPEIEDLVIAAKPDFIIRNLGEIRKIVKKRG